MVHTLLQGRLRFLMAGANDTLRCRFFDGCESRWDIKTHRAGVWLLGTSGVGKDNALAVLKDVTEAVKTRVKGDDGNPLPCFNELDIGRLSYTGLLESLEDGKSPDESVHWLSWTNSEIRQCLGKGDTAIQERDFTQLAEGAVIGKRVMGKHIKKKCTFWFAIGAHETTLRQVLGSDENGRMRGLSAPIDKDEAPSA